MKDVSPSRVPLLAGGILTFTAISQVLLANDRFATSTGASVFLGVVVFAFLVSIVRGVMADAEPYEAYDKRLQARARR